MEYRNRKEWTVLMTDGSYQTVEAHNRKQAWSTATRLNPGNLPKWLYFTGYYDESNVYHKFSRQSVN